MASSLSGTASIAPAEPLSIFPHADELSEPSSVSVSPPPETTDGDPVIYDASSPAASSTASVASTAYTGATFVNSELDFGNTLIELSGSLSVEDRRAHSSNMNVSSSRGQNNEPMTDAERFLLYQYGFQTQKQLRKAYSKESQEERELTRDWFHSQRRVYTRSSGEGTLQNGESLNDGRNFSDLRMEITDSWMNLYGSFTTPQQKRQAEVLLGLVAVMYGCNSTGLDLNLGKDKPTRRTKRTVNS
ncbi:hypothetical protein BCR39DRAFT_508235 [Naematelia encephala]|uniref:Uncharacterized protein n=1 Tax=Naematelia encephala TaxID=71784 RepID=A0A1Y2AHF7_9TREE|nr:hypothetical protein BCR39DRAFT_508235 [Naematelia encephala]